MKLIESEWNVFFSHYIQVDFIEFIIEIFRQEVIEYRLDGLNHAYHVGKVHFILQHQSDDGFILLFHKQMILGSNLMNITILSTLV